MRVNKKDFVALVLVIDDDRTICDAIAEVVHQIGHEARCASTYREGLEESRLREFALVLVDVQLPDGNGLDLLPRLREKLPPPEVIIMTGHGDPDGAELAIRNGAWDYIQKPSALENISLALTRALQYQEEKLKRAVPVPLMREMIIGNSLPIKECLDLVALAASSDANTLIRGETGTGKGFTPEFFGVLEICDRPGNVLELNQALERAMASAGASPLLYSQRSANRDPGEDGEGFGAPPCLPG
jgi:two-component system, NtrC family, response regulator